MLSLFNTDNSCFSKGSSLVFSCPFRCYFTFWMLQWKWNPSVVLDVAETTVGKPRIKIWQSLFHRDIINKKPSVLSYWSTFVGKHFGCYSTRFSFLTNKVKEIFFKMLHSFYATNHYLQKLRHWSKLCCLWGAQRNSGSFIFPTLQTTVE